MNQSECCDAPLNHNIDNEGYEYYTCSKCSEECESPDPDKEEEVT